MAAPITRLAGPHRLPTLLSILPNNGRLAVVQPAQTKYPGQVYLVTRSHIKYTSVSPAVTPEVENQRAGAKVAATQTPKTTVMEATHPMEGGKLRAHGKVYAMEFFNGGLVLDCRGGVLIPGRLKGPITKTASNKIRDGLKQDWVALDPAGLSEETKKCLSRWREMGAEHEGKRNKLLAERAERYASEREAREKERKEIRRRREMHQEEIRKIEVLY